MSNINPGEKRLKIIIGCLSLLLFGLISCIGIWVMLLIAHAIGLHSKGYPPADKCDPPPPETSPHPGFISIPLCGHRLYIPPAWLAEPSVRAEIWCVDGDRQLQVRETAIKSGESCLAKWLSLQGSLRPQFDEMQPGRIEIEPRFEETVETGRSAEPSHLDPHSDIMSDAPADAFGYAHERVWDISVLQRPHWTRPDGIRLSVSCRDGFDLARRICSSSFHYGSFSVRYEFNADHHPEAEWEQIDQNVIHLMRYLSQRDP